MIFWDSSAIVPLFVTESHSSGVGEIFRADPEMYVWGGTRTECVSALMRRAREIGSMSNEVEESRLALASLAQAWMEVRPSDSVRDRADLLLGAYALRAADAFQLAAALEWCKGRPTGSGFVSLDRRLREAARREGFGVLPLTF